MLDYPNDVIRAITELLFIGRPPEEWLPESDLVLVLGNDYIGGTIDDMANLFHQSKIADSAVVIFTGATGSLNAGDENECDQLARYAEEHYDFPFRVLKENRATNLLENFSYSMALIDETLGGIRKFHRILVIGKAFALRRAQMCAMKLGYPIDRMQYYGTVDRDNRNIGADCWWKSEASATRVMAEVERIGKYYLSQSLAIFPLEKTKEMDR